MRHQTELLAPAGSYDSLVAAVNAGADAIYLGGARFGARAYADNLDTEELCQAIRFAHLHGCDLYLTVNTLLKEQEMGELEGYLRPFYECGLDAVIVQDLGVLARIRQCFPDLSVHASTQMTILGADGAAFLKDLGVTRVVTARELSLPEIRRIHETVDIEIESFVHGALCYCYSGQCLFSSLLGGRSGNRGRCAQPCRLPYQVKDGEHVLNSSKEAYVLSPKDMCTVEILPDILEAGVSSLKIEGRMKRPEYTAGVVRIYRKYLDRYLEHGRKGFFVEKEDLQELKALYNRGGFSKGYYQVRNGRELMSLSRPGHFGEQKKTALREKQEYEALLIRLHDSYVIGEKKEKVQGIFRVSTKFPTEFVVQCEDEEERILGDPAQAPKSRGMTEEEIRKQLTKTGGTPFVMEGLEIQIDGEVFLPVSQLNRMRREALEGLKEKLSGRGSRKSSQTKVCKKKNQGEIGQAQQSSGEQEPRKQEGKKPWQLHVQLENPKFLPEVLHFSQVDSVYLTSERLDPEEIPGLVETCHRAGKECVLVLPAVFRLSERTYFSGYLDLLKQSGLNGIVVKNLEEAAFFGGSSWEIPLILDHNLYTFNRESLSFWKDRGILYDTLPLELNGRELAERGAGESEMIVYGHLPMMVTAGCLNKTMGQCRKKTRLLKLVDRYQKEFPVLNHCRFCYNVIYNAEPLSLLGNRTEVERLHPRSLRLCFTVEEGRRISEILGRFVEVYSEGCPARAIDGPFTKGHLKRGVE